MRFALVASVLLMPMADAIGQVQQHLAERNARINALYKEENYAATIKAIDIQLKEAAGTTWQDSIQQYLYKYGRSYRKVKDADAGVAAAERIYALVKERRIGNNQLEALFDLSWTYYDVGRMRECVRVDSTAVTVADGDPKVPVKLRGRARQYLAFDYSVIGDHRNSAKYALAALAEYAKDDSIPAAQKAESYTAVGVAYWHMGRIRAAEEQYMKAIEVLGDGTSEAILVRKVSVNGNLGVMWQNAGDFARAKIYYYESLRNSDRVIATVTDPFTRDEAIVNRSRTYFNLATVYFQLGDDGRARELMEIAWNDRSKVLEADDPQLLMLRDGQADLEMDAGDLDKADDLVSAYLKACERKLGKRSENYIRACSKLGDIASRKGQSERADSLFSVSIAGGRLNTDASTDAVLVLTLQSRARMKLASGLGAQAMKDLQHARRILLNIYDSAHYKVAQCDVRLAEAAMGSGDPTAALRYARSARVLVKDRERSLLASRVPRAFPDPHILPDAIYWSVRAQRAIAGEGSVNPEWRADLDLAISSLARNRSAVKDEASKLLLIGAQKRLFDLAMDVAYDAYAASRSETDIERFFNLSEADRSILLKGRLNGFEGLRFAGVPDTVIAQEQELIASLDLEPGDRAAATDMDRREKAYAEFLQRLEKEYPQYFNLRYGETTITLADLRKHLLTPQRDLLAYAMTREHLYLLVVDMDKATLLRVPNIGIADAVKTLINAIAEREDDAYVKAAHALYKLIFAPVDPLLKHTELLVITDGALHNVNVEVLLDKAGDRHDFRAHLLLRRYAIAYLLSATTAVQFAHLETHGSGKVLALAPGFSDDLKQRYLADIADTTMIDHQYLHLVRQPFAVRSAEQLGDLLSAHVMVGSDANEADFREQAKEYNILHLGTHAEMDPTSPLYSKLVLSKNGLGTNADADGYLHAYEIYELDLHAELAVLTACETGAGTDDNGEGVRSLGYSFAYAGCPSLVISLWSIDEKISSEIITQFYKNLADGMPKHLALRQAKLDHLASAPEELASPYYWAGMVLVGDVAPVTTSAWKRYAPWYIGGALLLAFLGWSVWRRSRVAVERKQH